MIEQHSAAPRFFGRKTAQRTDVRIPACHKAADLCGTKRRQHRFSKTTQFLVLVLIGIGAAGYQHLYLGEGRRKFLDGDFDLHPATSLGLRHLIEPVEQ